MKAYTVVGLALCAATLTACSAEEQASPPSSAATSETPPMSLTSSLSVPTPRELTADEEPMEDIGEEDVDATVTAPISPEAASQASDRATSFLRAYGRTDLTQEEWWTGVSGYFSPTARRDYAATDARNVPALRVVDGDAELEESSTPYRAQVTVPTSTGTYFVSLVRSDDDWLVESATAPSTSP